MTLIRSFPPLAGTTARVLILGSMPGVASLQAEQYYAHPRNAFWPIIGALLEQAADWPRSDYAQRVREVTSAGIAIWDVLAQCERSGSLDADITRHSEQANDIPAFIAAHPELKAIALNGRTAQATFRRHVAPQLSNLAQQIEILALPSTSPAHAALRLSDKLQQWSALKPWLHLKCANTR